MNENEIAIERLKEVFEASGYSTREIADKTGIPKSTVHRYVTGTSNKYEIGRIQKIAEACHASAAYVVGWTDDVSLSSMRIQMINHICQSLTEDQLGQLLKIAQTFEK